MKRSLLLATATVTALAVIATPPLSTAPFPEPGSRRLICPSDGSTAVEQVLENESGWRFCYIVWSYTTPAAAPIAYGVRPRCPPPSSRHARGRAAFRSATGEPDRHRGGRACPNGPR